MPKVALWLGLSVLIVVLDQVTKYAIAQVLSPGDRVALLPFFSLVLTYNPGAAFSFLASAAGWQRYFFIVIALVVSAVLVWMMVKNRQDGFLCFALALVLGGAIGNVIDRMTIGAVVDFILLHWRQYHWPAFNVADSSITVGAALLIWDGFVRSRGNEPRAT
jgi:signal peptidase II